MNELISPAEFVARALGLRWERWRSDWEACDCWGLVVLYFRHVLGVELGAVPQTDIATGFANARGWAQCQREEGAVAFMSWKDGAPRHCGLVLPGCQLLHADGNADRPGRVKVTRLAAMERLSPDLRFYRFSPC